MFSYGSGLTSTLFSLRLHEGQHPFSLGNIASMLDVTAKLDSRHVVWSSIPWFLLGQSATVVLLIGWDRELVIV